MRALALLLLLISPAGASEPQPVPAKPRVSIHGCLRVAKGCVYAPKALREAGEGTFVIYLRGLYQSRRNLDPKEYDASLAEAVDTYNLLRIADANKTAILITASSELAPDLQEITEAADLVGLKSAKLVVASHSGSWRSVGQVLDAVGPKLSRLLMLDNFYFDDTDGTAAKIASHLSGPGRCIGYYTANLDKDAKKGGLTGGERYKRYFAPAVPYAMCPMQDRTDQGHNGGVNACLGPYLRGQCCPAQSGAAEPDCLAAP